jgi:hypothetical protein
VIRTALIIAAALPSALLAQNGSAERPVSGAFTADQAERGEKVFVATCAACTTISRL